MESTCARLGNRVATPPTYAIDGRPTFSGIYLNNEKKTLFCRINKAGSRAAMEYFNSLNKGRRNITNTYYRKGLIRHERSMYYLIREIPLDEVRERFQDYRKVILVRHPLQRLVSAYYQIVVKGMNHLGKGIHNISQFITERVLAMDNVHWLDYQKACHPCVMDYDLVLKTESLRNDIPHLNDVMGAGSNAIYPEENLNLYYMPLQEEEGSYSSGFKYDKILRKLQRDKTQLFEKVLEKYKPDMKMFGYTWSQGQSQCDGGARCC